MRDNPMHEAQEGLSRSAIRLSPHKSGRVDFPHRTIQG